MDRSWHLFDPQSPIHDLIVKNDDLVVATHGRAFWILDSIAPLRQLTASTANEGLFLFKPDASYRYHWPEFFERRQPVGANAPSGAVLYYYFKDKPKGPVTLDILDASGKVIRDFSSEDKKKAETPPEWPDQEPPSDKIPAEAGMNRFVWDLRLAGPRELPGEPGAEFRDRGPMVPPGKYQVRISAEGKTSTAPIELLLDQRVKASPEDIQKSYALAVKVQEQISDIHDAVREIRETRTQLHAVGQRLGGDVRFKEIANASDSLNKKMTPLEEKLLQVNAKSSESNLNFPVLIDERLHSLAGSIDGIDAAPTRQQYEAFESLSGEARPLISQWNQVKSSDLVALNDMMRKDAVPVIYIAPASEEGQSVKAAGQNQ